MKQNLPNQEDEEGEGLGSIKFPPPQQPSSSSSSAPLNPLLAGSGAINTPAFPKKTRDLPNLSECHACGFRIDVSNGRNRLRTLYSEWRVVLLCKKCFSLVESSKICSYCFCESLDDCFCCRQCEHRVHRECFFRYRSVAPWSFSSSGSEFSVCIDCWIPKSIVVSGQALRSGKIRRKSNVVSDFARSRVSESLNEVVKDVSGVNGVGEKKGKKGGERKAQSAKNALHLVTERDINEVKKSRGEVVEDGELAFQLHRAMNSSKRISKNLNSMSLSFLGKSVKEKCGMFKRAYNKIHKDSGKNREFTTDTESDYLEQEGTIGNGGCQVDDGDADENVGLPTKEGQGSCSAKLINSGSNDNSTESDSLSCHKQDGFSIAEDERCKGKLERYFFKYSRRGTSDPFSCKYSGRDTTYRYVFKCRRRDKIDRYFFKYRRREKTDRYSIQYSKRNTKLEKDFDCRPKILYDGTLGAQALAAEVQLGCSEESRIHLTASYGSCAVAVAVEATGCESGSSGDQS